MRGPAVRTAAAVLLLAACGDGGPTGAGPVPLPSFVFVSGAAGAERLFYHDGTTAAPIPGSTGGDVDPQSAAGRLVFAGRRDQPGDADIYLGDTLLASVRRLAPHPARDELPSLSPDGAVVAFTSERSGVQRLWVVWADDTGLAPLATGSTEHTPEHSPRFSPDGLTIAFVSTRTGSPQIFIVPVGGGAAAQVTAEPAGAAHPSWSDDGSAIHYVDGGSRTRVHRVEPATGSLGHPITGLAGAGEPVCSGSVCLVVERALTPQSAIAAFVGGRRVPLRLGGAGPHRTPAFVRR